MSLTLSPAHLELRAEILNRLPEVTWDRCAGDDDNLVVYGWIPRRDGQRDFIAVVFWTEGEDVCVSFTTSSARLSATFAKLLYGNDAAKIHRPCVRVESVFGDQLQRTVRP
jgi:hypothetical protein